MTDYTIRVESVTRLPGEREYQELGRTFPRLSTENLFEIEATGTGWKRSNPNELRGYSWDIFFADGKGRLARFPRATVIALTVEDEFQLREGLSVRFTLRAPGPFERTRLPFEGNAFANARLVRREETTSARIEALRDAGFDATEALAIGILYDDLGEEARTDEH